MSKKKSGSTMTLKDFHGGSIPSDLPLPSAPGAVVRPTDRSGFDRPNPSPWGSPVGRSDHRPRPSLSGASRHLDDKAALLSHPPHIGRNFDEDERKPLDGSSAPRRTISDDAISSAWSLPFRGSDANSDAGKFHGRPLTSPLPMEKPPLLSSHVAGSNMGAQAASAGLSAPNVWATRKEVHAFEAPSSWSGPNAVTKFAQASALEKIQSGRWQSKPMAYTQVADVEVIRHSETEDEAIRKGKRFDTYDYSQVHQIADSSDMYGVRKGFQSHEKRIPLMSDTLDVRPRSADNNQNYTSSFQVQPPSSPLTEEMYERPKLNLLPRTKPLEKSEMQAQELNKLFSSELGSNHVEIASDILDNLNSLRVGSAGEGVNRVAERPKLNLKPRSQAIEQVDGSVESGRNTLFGGARPRELVLKERGVEPTMGDNLDKSGQPPSRSPQEAFRPDQKQNLGVAALRYGEREVLPPDHKNPRELDRKDYRPDVRRTDLQRNTWQTESMKSNRDSDKPQQEQRRPEPENWRKPVEPPKPDLPGKASPRQGRIATALELAQAFSTPASDVKTADRFGNQRKEIPFSRLTDSKDFHSGAPQRRINGY